MKENSATEKLRKSNESERLEFISSPNAVDVVARAVCALLNGQGGTVLVGVDEHGSVVGDISEQNADTLRSFLLKNISPQVLYSVTLDETKDGCVISVDVPKGRDRPYVFDGTVYVRSGSCTKKAEAETMRAMVEEKARGTERWERRPSSGLELKDLSENLIRQTVQSAESKRGYIFTDAKNIAKVLADLSILRHGQLTNAADVLFGHRVSMRQPQTRMRAVCFKSDKGGNLIDHQLFEGPAFQLLENAMDFLKRHISIAVEFPAGQLRRETRPQYPFYSLREGLINALVHRDYALFTGGISVSVYPDRVEIWNSGRLPSGITVSELRRETHASILVNPDISHVFYLHELMERVGRGAFKIVQECRVFGLRSPQWKDEPSGVRLTFFAMPKGVELYVRLNERQVALLHDLPAEKAIRTGEYIERYARDITPRQARRDLSELQKAGYLVRRGAGPATAYERTKKELESVLPDMSGHNPDMKQRKR